MGLTVINSVRESEQISLIEESLQDVFNNAISDLGDCNANLKFLNAKDMKILNYQFRNKNVCTNVLAFPNDSFAEDQFLGDIAICYDFCRQEAIEQIGRAHV